LKRKNPFGLKLLKNLEIDYYGNEDFYYFDAFSAKIKMPKFWPLAVAVIDEENV
jgi:hypothetical protein